MQAQLDKLGQSDDSNHLQTLEDEIFLGSRLLARLERAQDAPPRSEAPSHAGSQELKKLLKINIPTFHGDVMKWTEFWELFAISVHNNPAFANVQKFVVLKSHLAGTAQRCLQGIPVTEDGYVEALAILKERFDLNDVRREQLLKDLLNMPPVRHNDLKAIRSFIDHLAAHTRALSTLDVSTQSLSTLLLPVAKEKLPEDWRLEWARRDSDSFDAFLKFLNQEIRIREAARGLGAAPAPSSTAVPASVTSSLTTQRSPRPANSVTEFKPTTCRCGQSHTRLDKCSVFREAPLKEKMVMAKTALACFRCLSFGHMSRQCRSKGSCADCGRRHHSLLHNPDANQPKTHHSPNSAVAERPPQGTEPQHHRYSARDQGNMSSFFQSAVVLASGPNGCKQVRALFDGGSDTSYIRASLVRDLGLPVVDSGTFSCLGFQEKVETAKAYDKVRVELSSRHDKRSVTLDVWSTEQLCSPLPAVQPPAALPPLEMADDFTGGTVKLLIGIDHLYKVILWEQVEIQEGLRAVETIFGYVLHGQHDSRLTRSQHQSLHSRQVEAMWDLDSVGVREQEVAHDEAYSLPNWKEKEGRYEMALMWTSDERPISNQNAAWARTCRMTEKLSPERASLYDEQMLKMENDSVIEKSPSVKESQYTEPNQSGSGSTVDSNVHEAGRTDPNQSGSGSIAVVSQRPEGSCPSNDPASGALSSGEFYLPHHGVFRNGKLRVVFDGSATDGRGQSLNDYLDAGENLLRKLPSVLLNFRSGRVGCQADIQAAFHQVLVKEEDRSCLQFFWRGTTMRFTRVPFGLKCSPFMLLKTVDIHVGKYTDTDERLCRLIQTGSYMDDICLSFASREEAELGRHQGQGDFQRREHDTPQDPDLR